jgi:hypothetical protein
MYERVTSGVAGALARVAHLPVSYVRVSEDDISFRGIDKVVASSRVLRFVMFKFPSFFHEKASI